MYVVYYIYEIFTHFLRFFVRIAYFCLQKKRFLSTDKILNSYVTQSIVFFIFHYRICTAEDALCCACMYVNIVLYTTYTYNNNK